MTKVCSLKVYRVLAFLSLIKFKFTSSNTIYVLLLDNNLGHFHFQSNTRSSGRDETSRSHTKFKISTGESASTIISSHHILDGLFFSINYGEFLHAYRFMVSDRRSHSDGFDNNHWYMVLVKEMV